MPRVPTTVQDLIDFCNEHVDTWTPAPATLGLDAGDVTKLKTQTGEAADAVAAQLAAKDAAKSATLTANAKVATLRKTIAGLVRTIVTFAENSADPMAVFAAAQIAPTAAPTPSQPPGQPTNVSATLDDEGNITLKWKCANPPGGNVVYSVLRRNDSSGTFAQVGVGGTRSFTDKTVPAGLTTLQYQIRGFRGQTAGPASSIFTLMFGHAGDGGLSAGSAPFRMAA